MSAPPRSRPAATPRARPVPDPIRPAVGPAGGVAAVILAAGRSRRFGAVKQLALLEGRTLLEHVITVAADSGLRPIVVVVPIWLRPPDTAEEAVLWVRNPYPERGMSYSLRLGFAALPAGARAATILLGDQPTLPRANIEAVIRGRGTRPIVAAWADQRPAPPVLIERSHFAAVVEASGDRGLRDLLLARPRWVAAVAVPFHPPDVDTPGDLAALDAGE